MAVKVRAVNADKLCLAANANAAAAAHSRSVNHNRVERNDSRNVVLFRRLASELHHYRRSNRDHQSGRNVALAKALKRNCRHALFARASVVGRDDDFVANGLHFVNKDKQIFCARAFDQNDLVARFLQSLNDRIKGRGSKAAANANDRTVVLFDFAGSSQGAKNAAKVVAFLHLRKLVCGRANRLKGDGNPAFIGVGVCDCKRNALGQVLVNLNDKELAGLAVFGNVRRLKFHVVNDFRKLSLFDNFVHALPQCVKKV